LRRAFAKVAHKMLLRMPEKQPQQQQLSELKETVVKIKS